MDKLLQLRRGKAEPKLLGITTDNVQTNVDRNKWLSDMWPVSQWCGENAVTQLMCFRFTFM